MKKKLLFALSTLISLAAVTPQKANANRSLFGWTSLDPATRHLLVSVPIILGTVGSISYWMVNTEKEERVTVYNFFIGICKILNNMAEDERHLYLMKNYPDFYLALTKSKRDSK